MRRILLLLVFVAALYGCSKSYLDYKYGANSPTVVTIPAKAEQGKSKVFYAWHPYTNVMVGNPEDGSVCALPADGVKLANSDKSFGLGLTGPVGPLTGITANASSKNTETFTIIAQEDSRAAAAENTLSNLCLLRLNGWIKDTDLKEMYLKSLGITMASAAGQTGQPGDTPAPPADKPAAEPKAQAKSAQKKPAG